MADEKDESWKDTNVGAIGSDEDKAVRKAAALTEPAWEGAGSAAGIKIWRIEDFQVVAVPPDTYGKFHEGDSYIILQTIEDPESSKLSHKIFFWLGKESSADERGTAAYKTVELDDLLDQEPSQHRESQRQGESDEFKALFADGLEYLPGGCPTGFKHVVPEGHENKLYQVRKHKGKITTMRVPLKISSLQQSDCFILDAAEKIYVLQGPKASADEKFTAAAEAENIENTREGKAKATQTIDDGFWDAFEGAKPAWATPAPAAAPAATPAPAAATAPSSHYSLEELQNGLPPGVEASAKEDALTDKDFQDAFGMSRDAFKGLAKWKQQDAKKKLGIF